MHGIIHAELKKYVLARLGPDAWNRLVQAAGLGGRVYQPDQAYPDEDAVALVTAATKETGMGAGALLEDFGEFITPDLLSRYKSHVNPRWKTLDFLEHTESTIHRVVRSADPGATPPRLVARREGPRKVVIRYASPRKMCGVAKGIVRGAARHYAEAVEISEPRCMHRGDAECEIVVTQAK